MVSRVNTDLASGHFQDYGVVQPSMDFWRALAIEFLDNKIGVELGYNGQCNRSSKLPIYVSCEKITVKHHDGMWYPSKKKVKIETEISKAELSEPFKMW